MEYNQDKVSVAFRAITSLLTQETWEKDAESPVLGLNEVETRVLKLRLTLKQQQQQINDALIQPRD
jgi:hypothetical protein